MQLTETDLQGHTDAPQWGTCWSTQSAYPTMTRKTGEEAAQHDGTNSQPQRSTKGNQTAAKLEQFAHTPATAQTPTKGGQPVGQQQTKTQLGFSSVRKSQGQTAAAQESDPAGFKTTETETLVLSPEAEASTEGEPSLKEILQAVNNCKFSLCEVSDQLKCIKEDLSFLRHDFQKVRERTTVLEGRLSSVKDDLNPIKQEIKAMREKANIYVSKMEDMENRLHRNIVRRVGLPERSEGPNPIKCLENWFKGIFGKNSVSIFCY